MLLSCDIWRFALRLRAPPQQIWVKYFWKMELLKLYYLSNGLYVFGIANAVLKMWALFFKKNDLQFFVELRFQGDFEPNRRKMTANNWVESELVWICWCNRPYTLCITQRRKIHICGEKTLYLQIFLYTFLLVMTIDCVLFLALFIIKITK